MKRYHLFDPLYVSSITHTFVFLNTAPTRAQTDTWTAMEAPMVSILTLRKFRERVGGSEVVSFPRACVRARKNGVEMCNSRVCD